MNRRQYQSNVVFVFQNNWFFGLDSVISLQRLPRTILFKLICRVYTVNRFSKHRRGTTRACMECPGLYGDLQTGFEPIKFLDTRSVWVGHVINNIIRWYLIGMRARLAFLQFDWSKAGLSMDLPVFVYSHTKQSSIFSLQSSRFNFFQDRKDLGSFFMWLEIFYFKPGRKRAPHRVLVLSKSVKVYWSLRS